MVDKSYAEKLTEFYRACDLIKPLEIQQGTGTIVHNRNVPVCFELEGQFTVMGPVTVTASVPVRPMWYRNGVYHITPVEILAFRAKNEVRA